ncbi:MAG: polysaccharide deacetylase family protein [Ruminococcus sp.]|nr:polysaccharide deacetylase family protein [Ruminococcus sp.]
MRFIILTKRSILIIMLCAILGIASASIGLNSVSKAVATVATERVIPIYSVDTKDKICSISFDAAWGNEQTDDLLNTLDKYNIKTTFFLVGSWVKKYPQSVKKIAKKGHDIGNHSADHAHMTQLSLDKMKAELKDCNSEVEKLTGKCPTLFRPPYGDYDNNVVNTVKEMNMYCVQWNIDSLDWKDPSSDQIVQNCISKLEPGSIILLHNGAKNTPAALPKLIEAIQNEGYKIVPISKIIPKGNYTTDIQGHMNLVEN